jgi:hypothetical protein
LIIFLRELRNLPKKPGFLLNNRLEAGKYLVAVKGSEDLTKQAAGILQQFEPEDIQGYTQT